MGIAVAFNILADTPSDHYKTGTPICGFRTVFSNNHGVISHSLYNASYHSGISHGMQATIASRASKLWYSFSASTEASAPAVLSFVWHLP